MSPVSLLLPSILTMATGQTALVPLLCVIPPHCSASLPGPSPKHISFQHLLPLNISFSPNVRWLSSTWQKKPHSFTLLAKFCRPFHHPIRILDWQKGPWFSNPAHNSTATHTIYWLLQIDGCQTKPVAKSPGSLALRLFTTDRLWEYLSTVDSSQSTHSAFSTQLKCFPGYLSWKGICLSIPQHRDMYPAWAWVLLGVLVRLSLAVKRHYDLNSYEKKKNILLRWQLTVSEV